MSRAGVAEDGSDTRGWIERYGIQVLLGLVISLGGWAFTSFEDSQKHQGETLQSVQLSQAVTNSQLLTLNAQLKDVPTLMQRMSQAEVRIERNSQDIHDLQATRKLR